MIALNCLHSNAWGSPYALLRHRFRLNDGGVSRRKVLKSDADRQFCAEEYRSLYQASRSSAEAENDR